MVKGIYHGIHHSPALKGDLHQGRLVLEPRQIKYLDSLGFFQDLCQNLCFSNFPWQVFFQDFPGTGHPSSAVKALAGLEIRFSETANC